MPFMYRLIGNPVGVCEVDQWVYEVEVLNFGTARACTQIEIDEYKNIEINSIVKSNLVVEEADNVENTSVIEIETNNGGDTSAGIPDRDEKPSSSRNRRRR